MVITINLALFHWALWRCFIGLSSSPSRRLPSPFHSTLPSTISSHTHNRKLQLAFILHSVGVNDIEFMANMRPLGPWVPGLPGWPCPWLPLLLPRRLPLPLPRPLAVLMCCCVVVLLCCCVVVLLCCCAVVLLCCCAVVLLCFLGAGRKYAQRCTTAAAAAGHHIWRQLCRVGVGDSPSPLHVRLERARLRPMPSMGKGLGFGGSLGRGRAGR